MKVEVKQELTYKYISDDGVVFQDKEECKKHEEKKIKERATEEKLLSAIETLEPCLIQEMNGFKDIQQDYYSDYDTILYFKIENKKQFESLFLIQNTVCEKITNTTGLFALYIDDISYNEAYDTLFWLKNVLDLQKRHEISICNVDCLLNLYQDSLNILKKYID